MNESYFCRSNIPIRQMLLLMYVWAADIPVQVVPSLIDISKKSVIQWYQYCRDICSNRLTFLKEDGYQLGGPGHIVQIDESLLVKRKYHRGRLLSEEKWVFGLYDTTPRLGVVQFVPNRKRETLLPIIEEYVAENSTIWSDKWRAYGAISTLPQNYIYGSVNHRYV